MDGPLSRLPIFRILIDQGSEVWITRMQIDWSTLWKSNPYKYPPKLKRHHSFLIYSSMCCGNTSNNPNKELGLLKLKR